MKFYALMLVCATACGSTGIVDACGDGYLDCASDAGAGGAGAECTDPFIDAMNCGACGHACTAGMMCAHGACVAAASPCGTH